MKAALAVTARQSLERDYQRSMREYLKNPDESSLESAYELGRRALEQGIGVVEFAALHDEALGHLLQSEPGSSHLASTAQRLGHFFIESLSPFEMTHRGYRDAQLALQRLNETLESEARRIAHALHDEAGQLLVTVHFALENLASSIPSGFERQVEEMRGRLTEVEQELRRLSHELRPPMLDELGLVPTLDFIAQGVSKRCGIQAVVRSLLPEGRLAPLVEIALYRIVQEALTNVAKHSKANRVTISLREDRRGQTSMILCSVKDDGIGLKNGAAGGLGLLGIRERIHALGGSFDIKSAPGRGTELLLSIPQPDLPSSALNESA
jgi:signal transduction histidine kinase